MSILRHLKMLSTFNEMLLLTCQCLNIKIYIKGTENDYKSLKEQTSSHGDDYVPTGFFPKGEVEVCLDTKGIKQEHSYLVHKQKQGNYYVFQCVNCSMPAYATSVTCSGTQVTCSGTQVIVNNQLLCNPSVIERKMHSPDFSEVFHIVLISKDNSFAGTMPDPKSAAYEYIQSTLNSIQKQLSEYLIQQEASMENRIRIYEETQKEEFHELQTKVKEEKKKMISLLLSTPNLEIFSPDSSAKKESHKNMVDARKSPSKKKVVTRVKSMPPTLETEEDTLFTFDGANMTDEPFDQDTYSNDDDDDYNEAFIEETSKSRPKPKHTYSSSVPISVPVWNVKSQQVALDDEDEEIPEGPDQIAASMQALAQSITDDNRYIFGDRPRPRLNTGDFS